MVPYSFDTEVAGKNLQSDGFTPQQASSLVKFMVDAQQELATKADLDLTRAELQASFAELKTELKTDMSDLRTEFAELKTELKTDMSDLKTEFADLKTEVKTEIGGLRTEIAGISGKIWKAQLVTFGCLCAFVSLLFTAFQYFT